MIRSATNVRKGGGIKFLPARLLTAHQVSCLRKELHGRDNLSIVSDTVLHSTPRQKLGVDASGKRLLFFVTKLILKVVDSGVV